MTFSGPKYIGRITCVYVMKIDFIVLLPKFLYYEKKEKIITGFTFVKVTLVNVYVDLLAFTRIAGTS